MEVVAMISVKDMITRIRAQTHDHQMAGFQDWDSFQEALHGEAGPRANYEAE
jgi:hypothetical protein